jgi:dihydroorotase-like cyclic amidohydrolase
MLVDNEATLEKIFSSTPMLIAVHCEDETTVQNNLEKYKAEYGEDVPVTVHHLIRSEEACYISSSKAVALAKKTGHVCIFSFIDCQRNGFVHKQNSIGTKENYCRSLYTPFMVYQ